MCGLKNGEVFNGYVKEYENLRTEIMDSIKLYNSLTTLTLTAIIAFLGYLISEDVENYVLHFIPVPIIIAISLRVLYYRRKIAEISAYMIVFLETEIEDMNWETRNNKFENKGSVVDLDIKCTVSVVNSILNSTLIKLCRKSLKYVRYTEFLVLILMCFARYCYRALSCTVGSVLIFSAFICAIIIELIITIDMNLTSIYRRQCVKEWKKIKKSKKHRN